MKNEIDNDKTKDDKKEKHVIKKGGFYANLDISVKGLTIFIIVLLILLVAIFTILIIKTR